VTVQTAGTRPLDLGSLIGRLVVGLVLAAGATAALAWWMSAVQLSKWWLLIAMAVPATLAAVWAGSRRARRTRLLIGLAAGVVCALVTWQVWTPVPALDTTMRAHRSTADAVAEPIISTTPVRSCHSPTAAELGVLAQLGPWAQVCVHGPADGSFRVLELDHSVASGEDMLTYSSNGSDAALPDACVRHVTGRWFVHAQANLDDPGDPCPSGFRFQGGG
jgi:hypothetical protein